MISKRAKSIDSSGIRRVFDLASKLTNPINLSIGQPDFEVPSNIRQAAISAIEAGENKYTVTQGIPELRQKIREQYTLSDNSDFDVFITSGVSGGLFLSYAAVLDPGDEILIPDPFFCLYRDLALLMNAVPTYYDTYPNFALDIEKIDSAITSKTKAILLSSPSNPTGHVFSQEELAQVTELARRHNIWIIYDEIYEFLCYDAPHTTPLGSYENVILLNGFSKSHAVPGWRVGYALGPSSVIEQMLKIQQYSFVCAPSIAQWGLLAGVGMPLDKEIDVYREKRDFICSALKDSFEFELPGGAFYLFLPAPGGDSQAFTERCIEKNLLVVPGHVFSRQDTHFRISYSAPMEMLEKGAEILRGLRACEPR